MSAWRGRFNDGRSAARIPVRVSLDDAWLRIASADGRALALWSLEEVTRIDDEVRDGPLRLRLREDDGARLTLTERGAAEALRRRGADLGSRRDGGRRLLGHLGFAVLGLAGIVLLLWLGIPALSRTIAAALPVSWEEALGERVKEQALEAFSLRADAEPTVCTEAAGRKPLDAVIARLAAASDSPYSFRVEVVDLDIDNAFAMPGGHIIVFDGLLEFMEEPEELTAVLAHEMAHVVHRHGTEGLVEDLGLSIVFGFLLGDQGAGVLDGLGRAMVGLSYSRDAETEADSTALDMLETAGLTGDGLAIFFSRLAERDGGLAGALSFLSTHPSSAARAAAADARGVVGDAGFSDAEWAALRAVCGQDGDDGDDGDES